MPEQKDLRSLLLCFVLLSKTKKSKSVILSKRYFKIRAHFCSLQDNGQTYLENIVNDGRWKYEHCPEWKSWNTAIGR